MAITNGYCTLAELRERVLHFHTYTAATISFAQSTKIIADTGKGLARFLTGQRIQVSGSVSNNGFLTVATGGVAAQIVTTEALVNENAGASVTISDATDIVDDAVMEQVVESTSRTIDNLCGQRFYLDSANVSRYFTASSGIGLLLPPPGLGTINTFKTDDDGDRVYETTWAATDYDLMPLNAATDGAPYTWIQTAPQGRYTFSTWRRGIEISAKWGWPAVPKPIQQATLLLASRFFKLVDAPFGVTGNAEMGLLRIAEESPDVKHLLASYRRST